MSDMTVDTNLPKRLMMNFYDAFSVAVTTKPQNMCEAESFRDVL